MKILLVSFTFPPNKDGVSEAVSTMAEGFTAQGWEVHVATSPATPRRHSLDWNGAHITEFDIRGSGHPRHPYVGQLEEYYKFTENRDWDVVIIHSYVWSFPFSKKHLRKIRGHKIVVGHGYSLAMTSSPHFPWGLGTLAWSIFEACRMTYWLRFFDRAVYLSPRIGFSSFFDHLIACLVNHPGRRVIPNGIDVHISGAAQSSFREKLNIPADHLVFLCVANYSSLKNQGFAARAFRQANIPDSVLVFVGSAFNEWSDRYMAEDQIHENPSGTVIWLEGLSREETLNAYSSCDVFVLSSKPEAQGLVLLEAMRAEKPWIARKTGSIPDLVGGICIHTEAQMATAMRKLACDPALRKKMGTAGSDEVRKKYSKELYIRSYIDLIGSLVTYSAKHSSPANAGQIHS